MTTSENIYDLTKGAIPILLVIAAMYAALQVGTFIERLSSGTSDIDRRFKAVEDARKSDLLPIIDSIKELRSSVEEITKTLRDPNSRAIPTDLVRLTDLYVFCLQMQVKNPTINFACEARP